MEYKTWSDSDLRLVLQHPQQYRPEAMAAAEAILRERNVPLVVAVPHVEAPKEYDAENGSLLEPLLLQRRRRYFWPESKWMRTLFAMTLFIVLYWSVYGNVLLYYRYFSNGGTWLNFRIYLNLFLTLLEVLALYLAAQRDAWGWYILCADFGQKWLLQAVTLYYYMKLPYDEVPYYQKIGIPWLFRLLVLIGLFRQPVLAYFGVPPSARWKVALASLVLMLVFWYF